MTEINVKASFVFEDVFSSGISGIADVKKKKHFAVSCLAVCHVSSSYPLSSQVDDITVVACQASVISQPQNGWRCLDLF